MKQKIVIKVHASCEKCIRKAMKIAVKADGVTKVELNAEKDELVVIGNEVDSVILTRSLRKKLCFASLLSVQEEKDEKKVEKKEIKPTPTEKKDEKKEIKLTPIEWAKYCQYHSAPYHQFVVEPCSSPICSIM